MIRTSRQWAFLIGALWLGCAGALALSPIDPNPKPVLIPSTSQIEKYEWRRSGKESKTIDKKIGDELLNALRYDESIARDAGGEYYAMTVTTSDGKKYHIGLAPWGGHVFLPDGAHETKVDSYREVVEILKRLDQGHRDDIFERPRPFTHEIGSMGEKTLSELAQKIYGDARQWKKIYEANRDVIKDPDVIKKGMKITIPK